MPDIHLYRQGKLILARGVNERGREYTMQQVVEIVDLEEFLGGLPDDINLFFTPLQ